MYLDNVKTNAGTNYLTEKEEQHLFSTIKDRRSSQANRDYVLLKVCRLLGLRRGEVLALNVGDVQDKEHLDLDERIAEKGGLGKLHIPEEMRDLIRKFLYRRRMFGETLDISTPLFVSKKGNRLSSRAFNDLMNKWCLEAGLPRYTPHALRHTKAQRIMADIARLNPKEQVKKLLFIKKQLRHKSINASAIYAGPTKEEMDRVARI